MIGRTAPLPPDCEESLPSLAVWRPRSPAAAPQQRGPGAAVAGVAAPVQHISRQPGPYRAPARPSRSDQTQE